MAKTGGFRLSETPCADAHSCSYEQPTIQVQQPQHVIPKPTISPVSLDKDGAGEILKVRSDSRPDSAFFFERGSI